MAPPRPPVRRLRVFAFDPLLSSRLDTAAANSVTFDIPWENDLKPGPVGEYLEVIDADKNGKPIAEPVDLNHPHLLATDGLQPSESDLQFHQQMVYAVAMNTIRHFEQALGRPALWSPRRYQDQAGQWHERYVQRLRIYPHGLEEANAYFDADQNALRFGYFTVGSGAEEGVAEGTLVFTSLSHDVIAHETTHALLNGMHRRFLEPSNPDVLAFHEAFADLVALFQHFSLPAVLRHQIAQTRGDLASQNLLGELAQQFGRAIGQKSGLRNALGKMNPNTKVWEPLPPNPTEYRKETEPHARGALLLAAVFDAFLAIYRARVGDLLRIATGGSGVLQPGELHPDLVNRLAKEASKSARHVLTMCIRALDYCPPVDLTFGDFLRALITADADLVPDDDLGYRLAVIEGFRRRGLYPRDVRSLSTVSLRWCGPEKALSDRLSKLPAEWWSVVQPSEALAWQIGDEVDRARVYRGMRRGRARLHEALTDALAGRVADVPPEEMVALGRELGLDLSGGRKFEVHAIRPCVRIGPDGQMELEFVVSITQKTPGWLDERERDSRPPDFWMRGGCTLILDSRRRRVRYIIKKDIRSQRRLERQRQFELTRNGSTLGPEYFDNPSDGETDPLAGLRRG